MDKVEFKQDITINDSDFTSLICNLGDSKYKLIVTGNGLEYTCVFQDLDKKLDRLKNALKQQHSLSISSKMVDTRLEISLQHPLITLTDKYLLTKSESDISLNAIMDHRIKELESSIPKEYIITKEMVGKCFELAPENDMNITFVENRINEYDNELIKAIQNEISGTNLQKKYIESMPHRITDFYNIKYLWLDEIPVKTKNQILINKHISFQYPKKRNEQLKITIKNLQKTYTLLSKKFNEPVIGLITKDDKTITINMGNCKKMYELCPGIKITNKLINTHNYPYYECLEKDFLKYCYLCELPFVVDDGVYGYNNGNDLTTMYYCLIKNNKVYIDIENLENGVFTKHKGAPYIQNEYMIIRI